jgi:hypothetical protein
VKSRDTLVDGLLRAAKGPLRDDAPAWFSVRVMARVRDIGPYRKRVRWVAGLFGAAAPALAAAGIMAVVTFDGIGDDDFGGVEPTLDQEASLSAHDGAILPW